MVGVLVVVVLILLGVVIAEQDDSETTAGSPLDPSPRAEPSDEPDDPIEGPIDEGPTTTEEEEAAPAAPPTPEELDTVVADISDFVEQERGLEFVDPVEVELADDGEFVDRLTEGMDEQTAYLEQIEVLYKALGLVDEDRSFAEEMEQAMGSGVVGFYDPVTKELVVRATALTPFTRVVIAHELTHALDDQHFDLDRPEYETATDEVAFGFRALVEGNASYIEESYFAQELTDDEQDEALREEMTAGLGGGIPDVSFALLELMGAPYIEGPKLVDHLLNDGGQERLDAAFVEPPHTSEQVLDPERFIAGEGAVDVTHPAADGELVLESVLGQLFIQLVLDETVSSRTSDDAAEGWGGDWAVTWRDGERSCMRLAIVGDTPTDSDELQEAWTDWADEHTGTATVEQAGAGSAVTVTACSS